MADLPMPSRPASRLRQPSGIRSAHHHWTGLISVGASTRTIVRLPDVGDWGWTMMPGPAGPVGTDCSRLVFHRWHGVEGGGAGVQQPVFVGGEQRDDPGGADGDLPGFAGGVGGAVGGGDDGPAALASGFEEDGDGLLAGFAFGAAGEF